MPDVKVVLENLVGAGRLQVAEVLRVRLRARRLRKTYQKLFDLRFFHLTQESHFVMHKLEDERQAELHHRVGEQQLCIRMV
ncbi:hypothetical protein GDO78_011345 [Eleutherodactylus coqui]|uniref:Uncharacterized protein n=1 Tax=Eleutherodactylus coqui TaxID=57060 RepID=A0A8J6F6T6_ELECQ|nr:hypothetical protein GDO78_011345 [Eleutherodactylus coqui]